MTFRPLVTLALCAGLVAGFAELLGHGVRRFLLHEFLFLGPDVIWTAPLVSAVLFFLLGLGLFAGARLLPRLITLAAAAGLFVCLGSFGAFYIFPQFHRVAALVLAAGLGVQAGRWAGSREAVLVAWSRRLTPFLAGAVVVAATGLYGTRLVSERRQPSQVGERGAAAPNVLLIVLDTVRAFNLSLYGYHRLTSPHLDSLAATGVTFDHAFATAPWTLPSHATMFTGRLPHELKADWMVPLEPEPPTLAEALSGNGYRSAGFSANTDYVSREVGLARGFAHFEDYTLSPSRLLRSSQLLLAAARNRTFRRLIGHQDNLGRKDASMMNRGVLRWLDRQPGHQPWFVFVNYYDAHRPYLPPEPYAGMFVPEGTEPDPRLERTAAEGDADKVERTAWAVNAYDGAIAWLDSQVGALIDSLRARGELDNTLIVITSDHGEEFGEHGLFDHGNSLYRQALQVPLVMVNSRQLPPNRRIHTAVSLRDLAVTITDLTQTAGTVQFSGRSLADLVSADLTRADTIVSSVRKAIRQPERYPAAQGNLTSYAIDTLRYIRNLGTGKEELYHFTADRLEQHDISRSPAGLASLPAFRALIPSHAPTTEAP